MITLKEQTEALSLLKNILSIPTVNSTDNEAELAYYLQKYFQSFGVEASVQQLDDKHGNVIVDIEGEDRSKWIVWNGHLDTVPYGNLKEWRTPPKEPVIEGDILTARGASDMKSGLAAMVAAICIMKSAKKKPRFNLRFIGSCDEEKSGLGAQGIMESNLLGNPEAIIIGEPTDLNLGIAQKGCLWLELTIKGKVSHSAYPWEGINAIQYGTKICEELQKYIKQYKHTLLNNSTAEITMLNGGVAPNMVPDSCRIIMDIRFTPNLSKQRIEEKLQKICNQYKELTEGRLEVEYQFLNHRVGIEVNQNNIWLKKLQSSIETFDSEAEFIGINYFTDGSVFTENEPIPVILFGPGRPDVAHKPNEYVEITKFYKSIDILINTFYNS